MSKRKEVLNRLGIESRLWSSHSSLGALLSTAVINREIETMLTTKKEDCNL